MSTTDQISCPLREKMSDIPFVEPSEPMLPYCGPLAKGRKIAIVAASPFLGHGVPEPGVLKRIADCGFNIIEIFPSNSEITKVLDMTKDANLKALLFHSHLYNQSENLTQDEIRTRCENTVKAFRNHEALAGWWFNFTPTYDQLAAKGDNSLKYFYDIIESLDPNHLIYINLEKSNLSQTDVEEESVKLVSYIEYLNEYQKNFKPGLWGCKVLPYWINNGVEKADLTNFYLDLELLAYRRMLLQRPFWVNVRSEGGWIYPIPTETSLRYQVFSALGYGAQGIVYTNYHQTENSTDFIAPVDYNGKETPIWGIVQKINKEVDALNNIFYKCQLIKCKHSVNTYGVACPSSPDDTFGPFYKIESSGAGVQLSHINTEGEDYILIVNHDIHNAQELTLRSAYYTVEKISIGENGLNKEIMPAASQQTIEAGGYLIFKFY